LGCAVRLRATASLSGGILSGKVPKMKSLATVKRASILVAGALLLLAGTASALPLPTEDLVTQGSWIGKYGADGYILWDYADGGNDLANLPSYISSYTWPRDRYMWNNNTGETRAVQNPSDPGGPRRAACIYNDGTVTLNLSQPKEFLMSAYLLDWDGGGARAERLTVPGYDDQTVSTFQNGKWYTYRVSGGPGTPVTIQMTNLGSPNAVMSALMFDPAGPPLDYTLTWNGGNGNWNWPNWTSVPSPGPSFPNSDTVAAVVNSGRVVVEMNRPAHDLTVGGTGEVNIGNGNTLAVYGDANVAPGAILSLSPGSKLVAGGGTIADLRVTGGTGTIQTEGTMNVSNLTLASTLLKMGGGTVNLQAVSAAGPDPMIDVGQGTLKAAGPNYIGSAGLMLSGGTFEVSGLPSVTPGLLGGSHSGNPWTGTPNPGNLGVALGPDGMWRENGPGQAQREAAWRSTRADGGTGPDNTTLIYTGEVYLGGTTTFIEQNDDVTILTINGVQLINNGTWNNAVRATYTPPAPGWYPIDIRFSNGGGGYGFFGQQDGGQGDSNWDNPAVQYGFRYAPGTVGDDNALNYQDARDSGEASLFRIVARGPIDMSETPVTVYELTTGSRIRAVTDAGTAAFGPLVIQHDADLTLEGAAFSFPSANFTQSSRLAASTSANLGNMTVANGFAILGPTGNFTAATYTDLDTWGGTILTGSATLNLDNTVPGTVHADNSRFVLGGTSRLSSKGIHPLGGSNADVTLAGGTLAVRGLETLSPGALRERLFDFDLPAALDPIDSGSGYLTKGPWPGDPQGYVYQGLLTGNLAFNGDHWQNAPGNFGAKGLNGWDNIGGVWFGKMNIGVGGSPLPANSVISLATGSDDGSVFWVDINNNGVFESGAGELIVNNNFYQGTTWRGGLINLPAGQYNVAIGFYEGSGGEWMEARYGVGDYVSSANWGGMTTINPGAQSTIWAAPTYGPIYMADSFFDVFANSTLDVMALPHALMGPLTFHNPATLTVQGESNVYFVQTKFAAPGTSGFNTAIPVVTGPVETLGLAPTILKQGGSDLIITGPGGNNAGATFQVQAGRLGLIEGNAAPGATVNLAGGNVVLGSYFGTDQTFNTTFTSTASGTITAGSIGGLGQPTGVFTIVPSITPGAGTTITLHADDSHSFVLVNGPSGAGSVNINATDVTIGNAATQLNISLAGLNIEGGTTTLITRPTPPPGSVTLTSGLTGTTAATLATQGTMTIDAQQTLSFGGQLQVSSGHLTILTPAGGAVMPSGLALWLNAGDLNNGGPLPGDGAPVGAWLDTSGLGRDLNNVNGTPTFVASGPNGRPAVRFYASDGADALWSTYNFDTLTAYTALVVERYTGGADGRITTSRTRNWLFGHHGGGDQRWYAEGWIRGDGNNNTSWHLYAGTITNDADPLANFWKDGTQLAANNTGSGNGNHMPGVLQLGAWGTGYGEASNGEVAEVLFFNRVLTSAELNAVGGYLSQKYGISTSYTGGLGNWLGNVRLAANTQLTLGGTGQAGVNSIGALDGGPVVTGPMVLSSAGAPTVTNASPLTIDATINATNFDITGTGTVALRQNLTVAPGGSLTAPSGTTLATQADLLIEAGSGNVNMIGTLDIAPGTTLTINTPPWVASTPNTLRGSVFFSTGTGAPWGPTGNVMPGDETPMNLDGAAFQQSVVRVLTGSKAGTILNMPENATLNVAVTGTTLNWTAWTGLFDGNADQFITAFSGMLTPPTTGTYNFHWNNDDAGLMYIDLNHDKVFQSTERVAGYGWNMNGNVSLTAGKTYDIIYMAREYGGGQSVWWAFTPPGGGERIVDPSDPTQAGMWSTGVPPAMLGDLVLGNNSQLILGGSSTARFTSITAGNPATIQGNATLTGDLRPGTSPGTLSIIGNFTMAAGSTYHWEHDGTTGDLVAITGNLTTTGDVNVGVSLGTVIPDGTYDIGTFGGALSLGGAVNVLKENAYAKLINSATVGVVPGSPSRVTLTLDLVDASTWTSNSGGGGTTAWNVASNWNAGAGPVPDGTRAAIVQAPTANQIATITPAMGSQAAHSLIVDNGGHVLIQGGTLNVANDVDVLPTGSLTVNGTLKVGTVLGVPPGILAGLMAHWPLDESSGTTAADASGRGHTGSLVGAAGWQPGGGRFGGAHLFNGATDIRIPYSTDFALSTFTVSAWVNIAQDQGNGGILGTRFNADNTFDYKVRATDIHGDVGTGGGWIDTSVDIRSTDTGSNGQGGDIPLGSWHMITYVIDDAAKQFRLYLDADLKRTIGYSGTPLLMSGTQQMRIGNCAGTEFLTNGLLDDVAIWNRALSASDILAVYNLGLTSTTIGGTLTTAGTTTFGENAILDIPRIVVAGGTTTGYPLANGTTLQSGTTLRLAGGHLAGVFTATNPSTTAGSYAYEIEHGTSSASLRGPLASLRKSTEGAATLAGGMTLNRLSMEAGTLRLANGPDVNLTTLNVSGGHLVSEAKINTGTLNFQGGTMTVADNLNITSAWTGGSTLISDGDVTIDASAASVVRFTGTLRVSDTQPAAAGHLHVILPPPSSMPVGLIARYPFNEGSGTTTADTVAGNNGTINPGATWVNDGTRGWVLSFPGSGSVTVPPAAVAALANQPAVSIAFWQYGDPAQQPRNDYCFEGRNAAGQRVVNTHIPWGDSVVYWDAGNVGGSYNRISKAATPPEFEGQWNYWVFTKDATTGSLAMYLNGNLWHSGTGHNYYMEPMTSFRIGSNGGGTESYYGMMDDFAIWNRSLSAAEVSKLYSGGVFNPQLGHLRLDPGTWVTLGGAGVADFLSIGTTGGLTVTGDLTLGPTSPATVHGYTNGIGIRATVDARTFEMSGPTGSGVTLLDGTRLTIASGGKLGVPAGHTLASQGNVLVDATSGVDFKGTLNVASGTLTLNVPGALPPPGGAVASWGFDETSGGTANDRSGNNYHGIVNDGTWMPGQGIIGGAIRFNNSNTYVQAPTNIAAAMNGASFSLSIWAKRESLADDFFMGTRDQNNPGRQDHWLHAGFRNANQLTFAFYADDQEYVNAAKCNNTEWHHWAFTYDATTRAQRIYVDGQLAQAEQFRGPLVFDVPGPFYVGSHNVTDNAFGGLLDEPMVYGRVLTPAEINALYRAGVQGGYDMPHMGNLVMAPGATLVVGGGGAVGFSTATVGHMASVQGDLTVDNRLNVEGQFNIGSTFTMSPGMVYEWDLHGGSFRDLVSINGDLRIDGAFTLRIFGAGGLAQPSDLFPLILFDQDLYVNGELIVPPESAVLDYIIELGNLADPNYLYMWDLSDARVLILSEPTLGLYLTGLEAVLVPEPGTLTLLAIGAAALLRRRRARQR